MFAWRWGMLVQWLLIVSLLVFQLRSSNAFYASLQTSQLAGISGMATSPAQASQASDYEAICVSTQIATCVLPGLRLPQTSRQHICVQTGDQIEHQKGQNVTVIKCSQTGSNNDGAEPHRLLRAMAL